MKCAECGGQLQLGASGPTLICDVCDQELLIPDATRTEDDLLVLPQLAKHRCPVCVIPLQMAILDSVAVEHCTECQGLLVDDRNFSRIVLNRRASFHGKVQDPIPFDRSELRKRRHCPGCEQTMDPHPYHGPSTVVLDSCFSCGLIWLDAHELTRIIQAPGIRPAFNQ